MKRMVVSSGAAGLEEGLVKLTPGQAIEFFEGV